MLPCIYMQLQQETAGGARGGMRDNTKGFVSSQMSAHRILSLLITAIFFDLLNTTT
jgi:hypothetical protein